MKSTKIITIIATLIIFAVFSIVAIRKNQRYCDCTSRRISCNSNLKQIGVGLLMYAQENGEYFPSGDNIKGLKKIIPLLNQTKVLICPKDEKRVAGKKGVLQEDNSSYIYLDIECKVTKVKYPAITVLAFDKPDNDHSHVNVLYMDGHASQIKMNKNYNCEDILTTAYKGDFFVPIRKLQLEKVRAMDERFTWELQQDNMEIIRNYHIFILLYILIPLIVYIFTPLATKHYQNKRKWLGFILFPPYLWFLLILEFFTLCKLPKLPAKIASWILCLLWLSLFSGMLGMFVSQPEYAYMALIVWFYSPAITAIALLVYSYRTEKIKKAGIVRIIINTIIMLLGAVALFVAGFYLYIVAIPILPPGHSTDEGSLLLWILGVMMIVSSFLLAPFGIIYFLCEIFNCLKPRSKNRPDLNELKLNTAFFRDISSLTDKLAKFGYDLISYEEADCFDNFIASFSNGKLTFFIIRDRSQYFLEVKKGKHTEDINGLDLNNKEQFEHDLLAWLMEQE